ncbi:ATP-dependent RecD-like DNA helicase [Stomatohabitans albus]|uniref:SF1B family DNA helicase RecD2 n=1 Tax=Stomatohabitans albus TaxID=3110766 RepID=UPI00300C56C2
MDTDRLDATISRVLWAGGDGQFAVVLAKDEDGDAFKATGPLADLTAGQHVVLIGGWNDHPKYGPTFAAQWYELTMPSTRDGMVKFLASDRFKGVGTVLARRITDTFPDTLDEVLTTEPERLADEVDGVSEALAQRIGQTWREAGLLPAIIARLAQVGIGPTVAKTVASTYTVDALTIIETDPYQLLDIQGISWKQLDALGRGAGIALDDPRRLAAGTYDYIRRRCAAHGHTVIARDEVVRALPGILGAGLADAGMRAAVTAGFIVPVADGVVSPERLATVERRVADRIAQFISSPPVHPVERIEIDPMLTDEQGQGVQAVLRERLTVLTGGPGTGKTTTIRQVVAQAQAADWTVAMCAPTGRAAKRMEELTGMTATTVHRLLEARPDDGGGFIWGRDNANPIEADLIICDEWSMADVFLTDALFAAVGPGTRVLLVGDADQLPPIGPGAVLRDLGQIPNITLTRLTTVHRQAAQSRIVTLAHEINTGTVTPVVGKQTDVFAVPVDTNALADRVAVIVKERAPAYFGCHSDQVQVLSAMYKGPAGVDQLNKVLRQTLNPAEQGAHDAHWREGDRVVVTRNDPELDVSNGDVGTVVGAMARERIVTVAFTHGERTFEGEQTNTLMPAWALTVHKSQGGEWPVVVLVLDPSQNHMLTRELVYTAATRAREGLLIVGKPHLLEQAAKRADGGLQARKTWLVQRVSQAHRPPF